MKSEICREQRLAEYVDGELSGIERLHVSRHLGECDACGAEAASLQRLGDLLRGVGQVNIAPAALAGLAGGVVSRVGAERALSWRALFDRAVEDWHWFLVGFGSVAAAFFSVTFVSAVLHFGPAPGREDSVSALLSNRDWQVVTSTQEGSLYVWATPIRGSDWRIALTSRERKEAAEIPTSVAGLETEQDLVAALGDALTGTGQPIDGRSMTPAMRLLTGALFDRLLELQNRQLQAPADAGDMRSLVYRLQFVTNTEVTAKGL